MSRVGSMVLSPKQAHNVEDAEGKGHLLSQVSATTFHCEGCEGCEVTSRIGEKVTAQPFDEFCGALYGVTGDFEGVFFF